MQGGNKGEEPKVKKVLTFIGIACMLGGYVIANRITNPLEAILMFFVAVVMVIAGTYLLFTTASIAILKGLKKKKNYYYKPNHFTSISGMLFRMKQNAVGMANICILSTMVLVMVSTTVCLRRGISGAIDTIAPYDIDMHTAYGGTGDMNRLEISSLDADAAKIRDIAAEKNIKVSDVKNVAILQFQEKIDGNTYTAKGRRGFCGIHGADHTGSV